MRTVWEAHYETAVGSDETIVATGAGVIKGVSLVTGTKVTLKTAAGVAIASAGPGWTEFMMPFAAGLKVNITGASGEATVLFGS